MDKAIVRIEREIDNLQVDLADAKAEYNKLGDERERLKESIDIMEDTLKQLNSAVEKLS
jgi:predicted  nucleic acid-binding Zn-ribbon protein